MIRKRGDDAADHAPQSSQDAPAKPPVSTDKQDAPNYKDRVDGGQAEPVEAINSANDE